MGHAPWLRIFCADSGNDGQFLGPHSTLEDVYRHRQLPLARSEGTRRAYEETLALWKALTGSPPLFRLAEDLEAVLGCFVAQLQARPTRTGRKMTNATVNKHLRHVRRLVNLARQAELLPRAARVRLLPEEREPKVVWTPEEIELLARHADAATGPRGTPTRPAVRWRAVLLVGYLTGLRKYELFHFTPEDIQRNGHLAWLRVRREVAKQGKPRTVPLVPRALRELDRVVMVPGQPVLGWPGWTHGQADYQLVRIQQAAGLPPHRRAKFKALRRACATQLLRHNPSVARMVLGHVDISTTETYYADLAQMAHQAFSCLQGAT